MPPIAAIIHRIWVICTLPLQEFGNALSRISPFKPSPMQKPKVLRAGCFTREPDSIDISAQILVHLQRRGRRPVGITAVGPGFGAPAWIHDCCWFGDGNVGEHLTENFHDFFLGLFVGLSLDSVSLVVDYRGDHNIRPWHEAWRGEGLEAGIVASGGWRGIKEVLRVGWPERLAELEEDLGVGPHVELLDRGFLPVWKFWSKGDRVILKDA